MSSSSSPPLPGTGKVEDLSPGYADGDRGALLKEVLRAAAADGGPGGSSSSSDPGRCPVKGDTVVMHYVGTLKDGGQQFDSSRDRGKPFRFTLGQSEVRGWDLGLATMKRGELAILTVRADLAYGDTGIPPKIPRGATLCFEVELLDFGEDLTPDQSGGVIRRVLEPGEGPDHPNEDSSVMVSFRALGGGKEGEEAAREMSFTLGEGTEVGVPRWVELAVEKMKKGERSRLTVSPEYNKEQGAFAVDYEVIVKSFELAKERGQLDGVQTLEQAKLYKDKGTKFFLSGNLQLARKKYDKAILFLEHEILQGEQEYTRRQLLQATKLNLAECQFKARNWIAAKIICDKMIMEIMEGDGSKAAGGEQQVVRAAFLRGEAMMQALLCRIVQMEDNMSQRFNQLSGGFNQLSGEFNQLSGEFNQLSGRVAILEDSGRNSVPKSVSHESVSRSTPTTPSAALSSDSDPPRANSASVDGL